MTDALGWRCKFGVIGPSTNTIVQPDFDDMRVPGVTNHYGRIHIENETVLSDEAFMAGTKKISNATADAVRRVLTCEPDYMVMGMSAVTFYDGMEGALKFKSDIEAVAGMGVSTGALAVQAALKCFPEVKRVAFLSPYFPIANKEVRGFLTDCGYEVVRDVPLRCSSWVAIAHTAEDDLRQTLSELNDDDVDAIIQVGTNLSMVRLAVEAERWFGKPVIAINTATYWHALRANGIEDRLQGFGRLMTEH